MPNQQFGSSRKATLASVLAKAGPGIRLNEHIEQEDCEMVFRHACKLELEGIVSTPKGLPYRSGPLAQTVPRSSRWPRRRPHR
jgi:ATP-dependent DNA ligase